MKQTLVLLTVLFLSGCAAEETPPADTGSASNTPPAQAEAAAESGGDFRMTVADVFTIVGRGVIVTGRIAHGSVAVGDTACLAAASGATRTVTISAIELFRAVVDSAKAGDEVGLSIAGIDQAAVSRGDELRARC